MSSETVSGPAPITARQGDAFCFRLKDERSGWNVLLPVPGKNQVDVGALVRDAPEFLSMEGNGPACRAAALISEQGEARVLAGVDEAGGICLVGHPIQATREVLTTLVRELLVLSSRFWRMPLEEFTALLDKSLCRPLSEQIAEKGPKDFSEASFRAGLRQSLERGRFPVVLLLDGASKDAIEAIAHLKLYNLTVRPLGFELYESWGVEVVVPKALVIAELGLGDSADKPKPVHRPAPPPPRTPPPRFQTAPASVAQIGRPEPAPEQPPKREWEPTRSPERPWATQPAPKPATEAPREPAPARPAPVEPASAPAEKRVWDGTMPGVMAGKRPPPKSPDEPAPGKGPDRSKGRR